MICKHKLKQLFDYSAKEPATAKIECPTIIYLDIREQIVC